MPVTCFLPHVVLTAALYASYLHHACFIDEEVKAKRCAITCPKPQRKKAMEPGLEIKRLVPEPGS